MCSLYRRVRVIGGVMAAALTMPILLRAQAVGVDGATYRIERAEGLRPLDRSFTPSQLALLEKLNRADVRHLTRLQTLIVPASWEADELAYSVLPARSSPGRPPASPSPRSSRSRRASSSRWSPRCARCASISPTR